MYIRLETTRATLSSDIHRNESKGSRRTERESVHLDIRGPAYFQHESRNQNKNWIWNWDSHVQWIFQFACNMQISVNRNGSLTQGRAVVRMFFAIIVLRVSVHQIKWLLQAGYRNLNVKMNLAAGISCDKATHSKRMPYIAFITKSDKILVHSELITPAFEEPWSHDNTCVRHSPPRQSGKQSMLYTFAGNELEDELWPLWQKKGDIFESDTDECRNTS